MTSYFGFILPVQSDKDEFSLQYCSVKHAIDLIVKTRKGVLMGKVDIKSAYRIIPVHPSDMHRV